MHRNLRGTKQQDKPVSDAPIRNQRQHQTPGRDSRIPHSRQVDEEHRIDAHDKPSDAQQQRIPGEFIFSLSSGYGQSITALAGITRMR